MDTRRIYTRESQSRETVYIPNETWIPVGRERDWGSILARGSGEVVYTEEGERWLVIGRAKRAEHGSFETGEREREIKMSVYIQ